MLILSCSCCGNQEVVKVPALFRGGTWSSSSDSFSTGLGHIWGGGNVSSFGFGSTSHKGSTELAKLLTPPPQPLQPVYRKPVFGGWGAASTGCISFSLFCIGAFSLLFSTVIFGEAEPLVRFGIAMLLLSAAFLVVAFILGGTTRKFNASTAIAQHQVDMITYQNDLNRWQHTIKVWENLFYCPKCDHVCIPNTGRNVPANQWQSMV